MSQYNNTKTIPLLGATVLGIAVEVSLTVRLDGRVPTEATVTATLTRKV